MFPKIKKHDIIFLVIEMQKILSSLRKAIENYEMIAEKDKIAVCLSGGKDSITLLYALKALQRFYPKKFDLIRNLNTFKVPKLS